MPTCQVVELVFCPVPQYIHTAVTRGGSSSSGGSEQHARFEGIASSKLGARCRVLAGWLWSLCRCVGNPGSHEEVKISRQMQRADVKEG